MFHRGGEGFNLRLLAAFALAFEAAIAAIIRS